ncbi:hypothetical protein ACJ72_00349 [Emergomyces africanus]|uniref:Uncharacterized protein n=1 Tax=Emergomyces africanus TaxID=1955775 RepID=A0A1B7P8C4_9EURO|nr:hypothetical protein ACJ72_00349 [Emergomyces africanus]
MSKRIPIIILDDDDNEDDEDEIQITAVTVCPNHRINSDPVCSGASSNPSSSQQTGNSSLENSNDGQKGEATRQVDGDTDSILVSAAEWLQSASPIERSHYFAPPLPSPTNPLSRLDNPCETNRTASPPPDTDLSESTSPSGQEIRANHAHSNVPSMRQFFMDMADTIAHIFPYEELACKYKCSVDLVNHYLIAVVLDPLVRRNNGLVNCENDNEEYEEEHGQGSTEKERGIPNVLINRWDKQKTMCELQRESVGKGLPREFEQILNAASGNAKAYWKERNAAFDVDACKEYQDAQKNEAREEGVAIQEKGYKNLRQQLEEMVEAAGEERPLSDTETTAAAAISLHEKNAKEDGSTTSSSHKRARSSSETIYGKDGTKSAPPSPSTATSPALHQLSSSPPLKKAKTTAYPVTPMQPRTVDSATPTSGPYHSDPKHLVGTDWSTGIPKLDFFPKDRSNNTDNHPTRSRSSSSFTSPSQSPPQTPTPLPRPKLLPHTTNPTPNPTISHPRSSAPPSNFAPSTRRHPVTIDKFGNYERVQPNQATHRQRSTVTNSHRNKNDKDSPLLPLFNSLRHRYVRESPATAILGSSDQGDFHDPYSNAGVDPTTRVFTEGLYSGLFAGVRGEERRRKLVGLDFGLEQIEFSGKRKREGKERV